MKKIKETIHSILMKFSLGNKFHHDRYWGNLFHKIKSSNLNTIEEQWTELFQFECGNKKIFTSIINEKKEDLDFDSYIENKYTAIIEFLNDHNDFEAFIELGSGWGRNIIRLQKYFPNFKYIACELSKSGRKVTELFSNKYDLNIDVLPFNYLKWKSLKKIKSSKKTIIFTSYSIEQVSKLDKDFFYCLLKTFDQLVVYHIEPVLFQIEGRKFPFYEYYNSHYNQNLFSILKELQLEKKIKIIKSTKSNFSYGTNVTSDESAIIIWKKI